ncbi:MAG: sugar transferase [Candidatus Omnitrophica bacterium]|nr:sugar transferase [Candidatus Omnitrophota bacterium]
MTYLFFKRLFDIFLSVVLLVFLFIPFIAIAVCIKSTSKGHILYWSDRVGINNQIFKMPKFRTMRLDAPAVATHLFKDAQIYITPIGSILRKFSLDELPQLLSIFCGKMSFVGPRPALFNQDDLVALRTAKGIQHLIPGLTGWAQVNGRDDLPIPVKVEFEDYYRIHHSFLFDLKILFITALQVVKKEGIQH